MLHTVPLWLRGSRIQHCHCSSSGHYCGMGSILSPGNFCMLQVGQKKKKIKCVTYLSSVSILQHELYYAVYNIIYVYYPLPSSLTFLMSLELEGDSECECEGDSEYGSFPSGMPPTGYILYSLSHWLVSPYTPSPRLKILIKIPSSLSSPF